MAQIFDAKKGTMKSDAMQRARCLTIVDHICSEEGEPLFTERDVNDIMALDAMKLDLLNNAIEDWAEGREGKRKGK